ncbi:MAG: putative Ig domain-containing protein [Bacteroidales bacterium]|jgi:autotransporter-associated beta strand protein|nr:putative Ig domain-containing protein [Bacteroidales bacterium]
MKKHIKTSIRTFCFILFCFLPLCALAQIQWEGTVNFNSNTTITQNITITSSVNVYVASGVTVNINGAIHSTGYMLTKSGAGTLSLNANNTGTFQTKINAGTLRIGNGGSTGTIGGSAAFPGNVVNDGTLTINRSNTYTYSGSISGTGSLIKMSYGIFTLSGVNSYTGATTINEGTFVLAATGSISGSSHIVFNYSGAGGTVFDISAGNKTIKNLSSNSSNVTVILGSRTLTIGNTGASDGGGTFHGHFAGTGTGGRVVKRGTATFTLTNPNNSITGTGTLSNQEGTLVLNGCKWGAYYYMYSAATLTVIGNVIIGTGTGGNVLSLNDGNINMNLDGSNPSKLTVLGGVSFSSNNKTTLNITTSNAQENYVLIQATSGITTSAYFTLAPVSGFPNAGLNVNSPAQLRFSTTVEAPPTITATTLPAGTVEIVYNQILTAIGFIPITWSMESGSLPAGLSLSAAGVISGTPTTEGTYNFTVRATNNFGYDTKALSITINGTTPIITTTTLPNGLLGTAYSQQLTATGTTPITWTLASGSLPTGLTLSTAGVISGTPTVPGEKTFTVKATNVWGNSTKNLSITIDYLFGSGTENDPYIITIPVQLEQLATLVNANNTTYNNKYYKLGNDIDLSDYGANFNSGKGWIPIGISLSANFSGTFDGDGQIISNLFINAPDDSQIGLFGSVSNGNIKNVGVEGINIVGKANVGGVVGYSSSSNILNCYTTGNITGESSITGSVGGVVGQAGNNSMVTNCYSTGNVSGVYSVGGVVGLLSTNSTVNNCYAIGNVSGTGVIGGVVGSNSATTNNCAALNPKVSGTGANIGRVIGSNSSTASNNIAFEGMLNANDEPLWSPIGATTQNGADISKINIHADGTLGGRFTTAGGWITQNGKLPGLFGNLVDMPEHLILSTPPTITTTTLPGGVTGTAYSAQLSATGPTPITWSLESGNLPNGLTLSAAGVISGTPTTAGTSNFTVKATNSTGSDTKSLSIAITTAPVAPTITTTSLPAGKTGTAYSAQLEATGTAPITWSLVSGSLPTGLTLSSAGLISGTPTVAGTSNFTVKAENSAGNNTKPLSITITASATAPIITTTTLQGGVTGTAYNQTLTATGTTPITWSLQSGTLPAGLNLSAAGAISGTPTSAGTSNFTVKATNSVGNDTKALSIVITTSAVKPTITTTTLPNGKTGTAYNAQLEATGTAPISWALASGNLPTGLTLYSGGAISGTPSAIGTFNFTVQATNSAGNATKALAIKIEDGVGIEELTIDNGQLTIYPNPTTGELVVSSEYRVVSMEVFDMVGRKYEVPCCARNDGGNSPPFMEGWQPQADGVVLDISHLSAGIYVVKIRTEAGEVVRKVVKE